jgi:hypothetical protein
MEDNSHAGQGAVLLDIGGDIGALVVQMPAAMAGIEIEIRPIGSQPTQHHSQDHAHGHSHEHSHGNLVHVAVVARPTAKGIIHSAVYPELSTGSYELYERPDGPVRLTATISGGKVTEQVWPDN